MTRPVSWFLIGRGWPVYGSDGDQVGRVEEVLGAQEEDIFNGLIVATGFFATRYVPAERIGGIEEGRIELDITADEIETLDDQAPPGVPH
jgi:uncharacterized protein YrrD